MQQTEALRQYYKSRRIHVANSCHPLTPAAQQVIGITTHPASALIPTAHAAVIFRENNRIYNLLNRNRRTKDIFGFPGGGMEASEAPTQCVEREIYEELGYEPSQYRLNPLGYLVAGCVHFPLYLADITDQIPVADEITGSTDIAIILLEELYRQLPTPAQAQVRSTIDRQLN